MAITRDGQPVPIDEATKAWAESARVTLRQVATRYPEFVTYKALAADVQADTGIANSQLLQHWIGPLLVAVQELADPDEPMLTSLVLRETQMVGSGYADAVERRYGTRPDDPDAHAAEERVRCYQYFGAPEPAGGWVPVFPPLVQREIDKAKKPTPRPSCSSCFTQAMANGLCPVCGEPVTAR